MSKFLQKSASKVFWLAPHPPSPWKMYKSLQKKSAEYIWIFVRKFLKIQIFLNIYFEPYFNICLSMFNDLFMHHINIQCKHLCRGQHQWAFFSKVTTISDEHEYLNIQIKWPSNIIQIHICAIFQVPIYQDICLVNMGHPNIFGYLFCSVSYVAYKYIQIFVRVYLMIFAHHWGLGLVFANNHIVHNAGVSRGTFCDCGCCP